MYIPHTFPDALILTILSAIFWGSWANSFKWTKDCPFILFYWDYMAGVLAIALLFAFLLGNQGNAADGFVNNLANASRHDVLFAVTAGIIFNAANLLFVAAIEIAGLTVAFPLAIGISIAEGVLLSYALQPKGNVYSLLVGVGFALLAVFFNARAYRARDDKATDEQGASRRGIVITIISGVLMGGFAPFIAGAMGHEDGLTPYTTAVLFGCGILLSSPVMNVYLMRRPLSGLPASSGDYFKMSPRNHLLGFAGGLVWGAGGTLNWIAAGLVGVPISFAIGNSAPLIAAAWGVFVWREFAHAPKRAYRELSFMTICFILAVVIIASAHNSA